MLHETYRVSFYNFQQFILFRTAFGLYLLIHFLQLLPNAVELFSNEGMISNAELGPLYGTFPNILNHFDSPRAVYCFIFTAILLSLAFIFEKQRQIASIGLWYIWICLFHRNIFIANPSLAYVGWLLLACSIIPTANISSFEWYMPKTIYWGAWFLMALGYSVSGIHKLGSPSWVDGSALLHILSTPLARNNWLVSNFLHYTSDTFLRILTWFTLGIEISFLPLGLFSRTRFFYWIMFCMFHVGILLTINFTDLTLGIFMIHLFCFDQRWLLKITNKQHFE